MISASVAPFFRRNMSTTKAPLLFSRGPALSSVLAAFFPLGAFLAGVAILLALAFAGAPLAARAPPLAFLSGFGFGGFASGLASSPRPWMLDQMRLAPTMADLKPFPGLVPGTAVQIAPQRLS